MESTTVSAACRQIPEAANQCLLPLGLGMWRRSSNEEETPPLQKKQHLFFLCCWIGRPANLCLFSAGPARPRLRGTITATQHDQEHVQKKHHHLFAWAACSSIVFIIELFIALLVLLDCLAASSNVFGSSAPRPVASLLHRGADTTFAKKTPPVQHLCLRCFSRSAIDQASNNNPQQFAKLVRSKSWIKVPEEHKVLSSSRKKHGTAQPHCSLILWLEIVPFFD